MKAISLWQPWATLVAIGAKRFETRSWRPKYRGLLAIHAAKRMDVLLKEYCLQDPFYLELREAGYEISNLPLGAIVAVVKLIDIQPVNKIRDSLRFNEKAFGNYADGRYAWQLELVKRLEKPIPMNGAQALFEVADDLILRFM